MPPDPRPKCTKRAHSSGKPCRAFAVAGTDTCRMHAGKPAAQIRAEGAVRLEVQRWTLRDATSGPFRDPAQVMLALVTQSAERVGLYSTLLMQAYEATTEPTVPAQVARLDGVFATGGVGALVGYKMGATKDGDLYVQEEAIRALVLLEGQERDRCASFATKAIAAGLAERQVKLAEQYGQMMYALMVRSADRAGLAGAERAALVGAVLEEIQAVAA